MTCFGEKHPEAKYWWGFNDFKFYVLHVKACYYVGGYGGMNYIGWLPMNEYRQVTSSTTLEFHIQL
ncbi:hypothetical protein BDC45DRAFT_517262 [Circinella umbellata]|nr:hypothetical protein BDC45DRAFT_517262 [Circinella umbellata]